MKTTMTRQNFNKLTATALLGATVSASCSEGGGLTYKELVKSTWRHTDTRSKKGQELLRELVRYATLAANSHNTQPWLFRIETNRITILPDFSRRCAVVDPDDHHLYVSLGCATENLVLAAAAYGFQANVSFDRSADGAIIIDLLPGVPDISSGSPMFQAIPSRQCTRADYDGKGIPADQLSVLEGKAQDEGVAVQIFTDKTALEQILEYVVAGNTAQINDEDFVKELRHWIRFSESAIIKHRDGLFSASSGNPTLPTWMGRYYLTWHSGKAVKTINTAPKSAVLPGPLPLFQVRITKKAGSKWEGAINALRCNPQLLE